MDLRGRDWLGSANSLVWHPAKKKTPKLPEDGPEKPTTLGSQTPRSAQLNVSNAQVMHSKPPLQGPTESLNTHKPK